MKNILVLGAGRTSTYLIKYLLDQSQKENFFVTVGDYSLQNALSKINSHPNGKAIQIDIYNDEQRYKAISEADAVISYLLPEMHVIAAKECLKCKTHLVTASYVSPQMELLDEDAKKNNLTFLNEMGLDPGIDHMDAARLINKVKNVKGKITSLKSYCGGLVSPEHDDNPWGYKFTWSPISVVLAGQAGAKYLSDSSEVSLLYNELFGKAEEVEIPGLGIYEAYPNRNSIPYLKKFDIAGTQNYLRATLRKKGFADSWNALVKLGFTNNSARLTNSNPVTYEEVTKHLLHSLNGKPVNSVIADFLNINSDSEVMKNLLWLGITGKEKIPLTDATPAAVLLSLLEKKWELKEDEKDMVILQTEVEYFSDDKKKKITSTMILKGKNNIQTAMTCTASLPAAIGVKLILQNKIKERGVIIPVHSDIYEPALEELEENEIKFTETEKII